MAFPQRCYPGIPWNWITQKQRPAKLSLNNIINNLNLLKSLGISICSPSGMILELLAAPCKASTRNFRRNCFACSMGFSWWILQRLHKHVLAPGMSQKYIMASPRLAMIPQFWHPHVGGQISIPTGSSHSFTRRLTHPVTGPVPDLGTAKHGANWWLASPVQIKTLGFWSIPLPRKIKNITMFLEHPTFQGKEKNENMVMFLISPVWKDHKTVSLSGKPP